MWRARRLAQAPASLEALLALPHGGEASLDERRRALIAKIGENISVRRFVRITSPGPLGTYIHGSRIGSWWPCRAATKPWRATWRCMWPP